MAITQKVIKIQQIIWNILTLEWYRKDFRCVCATRRRQARGEGRFIDLSSSTLAPGHLSTTTNVSVPPCSEGEGRVCSVPLPMTGKTQLQGQI